MLLHIELVTSSRCGVSESHCLPNTKCMQGLNTQCGPCACPVWCCGGNAWPAVLAGYQTLEDSVSASACIQFVQIMWGSVCRLIAGWVVIYGLASWQSHVKAVPLISLLGALKMQTMISPNKCTCKKVFKPFIDRNHWKVPLKNGSYGTRYVFSFFLKKRG